LNDKIGRFNSLEQQLAANREKVASIYNILAHDYYWDHLKKSEVLKNSAYSYSDEVQGKRQAYQNALNGDGSTKDALKVLTAKEAIAKRLLSSYSNNTEIMTLDKFQQEFKRESESQKIQEG